MKWTFKQANNLNTLMDSFFLDLTFFFMQSHKIHKLQMIII